MAHPGCVTMLGCVTLGWLLNEVLCGMWLEHDGRSPSALLAHGSTASKLCLCGLSHPALILVECCNCWNRKAFGPQLCSFRGSHAMIPKVSVFARSLLSGCTAPWSRDTTQEITQGAEPRLGAWPCVQGSQLSLLYTPVQALPHPYNQPLFSSL